MAAIAGGVGPRFAPAEVAAGRATPFPSVPGGRREVPANTGDIASTEGLVRFYEAQGQRFDEAVTIRQVDRTLGRLFGETDDVKVRLEQVKLYPPYPIDESRRARAIRDFNGLTAEVRRMHVTIDPAGASLTSLSPNASTEEAERAVSALAQVGIGIQAKRAVLAAETAPPPAGSATRQSLEVAAQLGESDIGGISRNSGDVLRRIG